MQGAQTLFRVESSKYQKGSNFKSYAWSVKIQWSANLIQASIWHACSIIQFAIFACKSTSRVESTKVEFKISDVLARRQLLMSVLTSIPTSKSSVFSKCLRVKETRKMEKPGADLSPENRSSAWQPMILSRSTENLFSTWQSIKTITWDGVLSAQKRGQKAKPHWL